MTSYLTNRVRAIVLTDADNTLLKFSRPLNWRFSVFSKRPSGSRSQKALIASLSFVLTIKRWLSGITPACAIQLIC